MDKDCGKMWNDKPVSVMEGQMERAEMGQTVGYTCVYVPGTAG